MAVLDLFLVWMMKDSYLGSGIYVFFLFLMGIQLTALRKLHSESFWLTVYPLPEGSKGKGTIQFVFRAHLVLALLTGLPLLLQAGQRPLEVLATFACGFLLAYLFKVNSTRKEARMDEDDL